MTQLWTPWWQTLCYFCVSYCLPFLSENKQTKEPEYAPTLNAAAAAAKSHQSCPTLWPHRWQPTRLPCPWDSPGKNTGVGCHFLLQCMKVKSESEVAQSCLTLSNPMDCSLPGSSVHGIFQARVLEWGAIAFSTSSLPNKIQLHSLGTEFCTYTYRGKYVNMVWYVCV